MDANVILGVFAVIATVSGVIATVMVAVVNSLKTDIKGQGTKVSDSHTKLWEKVNTLTEELSAFKEHVAINYPNDRRMNEKMEAHRQQLDSALSGITHRLTKLESESGQILQHVNGMGKTMPQLMESIISLKEQMDEKNSK